MRKAGTHAYPLTLFQFVDFFGNGAIDLMDTIAVAAVNFCNFPIFQNDFHHPRCVQLAAISGNKFFHFHLQILRDAEAPAADDQMILGNNLHVYTKVVLQPCL